MIGAMLAQIGIEVDVAILSDPSSAKRSRPARPISSGGATPSRFDSWSVLKNRYRSDAQFAGTGYADPEVDALIDQIEGR
jgi:ABC-type transport system substrate-binding protein